jgi:hypothetical protein
VRNDAKTQSRNEICSHLGKRDGHRHFFTWGTFLGVLFAGGNAVVEVSHTVDCVTTQDIIAAFKEVGCDNDCVQEARVLLSAKKMA